MTEHRPSYERVEELISQDAGISPSQLKEFHVQLEQSLEQLERQAQSSRRATLWAVAAVVVGYVFGLALQMTREFTPLPYNIIIPLWAVGTWIALIIAGVLGVRYWSIHRPALERGRIDLQIAMFGELQRQIAALNHRLGERG
jgi:hypothetical protein